MPFAQLQDARIHYDLIGPPNSPVLVFSNSLGTNFSMWDSQVSALQKSFRVLRSDTRGHGQSSSTPGPYSIEQLSKDLLFLLDSLQFDRVYFCGLSMGGMIGMWLSLNAPQRLHKVVFCNTAAKIGTPEFWNPRIEKVLRGGMRSVSAAVIDRWFTPAYRSQFPDIVAATQRMLESADPQGYVANCAAVRDFDARSAIPAIQIPTLIIAGTHDPATTVADARFLNQQIKASRLIELQASHLSNIEAAAAFNQELSSFLLS